MKKGKILLIVSLIALMLGGGIYYLLNRKKQDYKADDSFYDSVDTDKVHTFSLVRATPNLALGFAGYTAPVSVGSFPLTQLSDDSKFNEASRAKWADFIKNTLIPKYAKFVEDAAALTKVPTWMIYGIMATEIDPKKMDYSKSSSGAKGVMQIMPITATDTIVVSKKLKNYNADGHEAVLVKTLGQTRADKVIKAVDEFDRSLVEIGKGGKAADLYNAELNIHIGALKLANLLDIYGQNDLSSVVVSYNKGDKTAQTKYGINGKGIAYALSNTSGEARDYILRTLGKHGSFDIITNDLGILV